EAGFPEGVVNMLPGYGDAGAALVDHPDIDKIAFTGSTEVGKLIQRNSAGTVKRITLELGGKSPNIIFADTDLERAVELFNEVTELISNQARVHNHEQLVRRVSAEYKILLNTLNAVVVTGSRTFVEDKIYDKFVEMAAERAKKRVVGDPFKPETEQGPQIDAEQQNRILSLIESGKKQGAKLVAGGGRGSDTGYFVQPTVFSDVKDHMDIATTEIFGPVQQILKFSQLDEVVERANNSEYGLAAAVFTQDIDKANYVVQRLRAGTVWVNDYNVLSNQVPFGGYKQSGIGRENGPYGINNYTEVKAVITKLKEKTT
ncbi:hypothetical protein SFRURICE_013556, partial [Spodoptera frugiperda]